MKKYIKGAFSFLGTSFLVGFFIVAGAIAASQIQSFDQPISEGSIITSEYYNKISSLLKGSKSEGKYCKFSGGKIVCLDDMPNIPVSPDPEVPGVSAPTVMQKIHIFPATNTPEEKVAEWNALVDTTYNKWIELPNIKGDQAYINELTEGWYASCKIKPGKYQLESSVGNSWSDNVEWCGQFICGIGLEKGSVNVAADHCGNGTIACPKANYSIICMY